METATTPTILVIIGITGDLARRKLLPAIAEIAAAGALPKTFQLVGVSRRQLEVRDLLEQTSELNDKGRSFLSAHLIMHQMDLDSVDSYRDLNKTLDELSKDFDKPAQRLFYLSIPPQVSQPVVTCIGESGLAAVPHTKLLLEKPFGTDLESAKELIAQTKQYFREEQLYRIDHYLAKEMAQNILVFRGSNPLFRHTWNRDFIDKIEIITSEKIGIEGRASFYEQTGALRDVVQSHLLQLAALTLMDIPAQWKELQAKRLQALLDLQPPSAGTIEKTVRRGQYSTYAQEVGNPGSTVETFAALTLFSKDPKWTGVPIQFITGKALDRKATEVRVYYKQQGENDPNIVTLRVQPEEGIEIKMWAKRPGYSHEVEQLPLHFTYRDHYTSLPEAYERVLVDSIRSDHMLFTSSDEVLASWRVLAPIQQYWSMHSGDIVHYRPGSTPGDVINNQQ